MTEDRLSWGVERRVALGFAASVVLIFVLGALSLFALRRSNTTDQQAFDQANQLIEFGRFQSATERKMTAFRGYLVSGEESYLRQLQASRAALLTMLAQLVRETAGNERALLDTVGRSEQAHQRTVQGAIALRRSGARPEEIAEFFTQAVEPQRESFEAATARYLDFKRETVKEAYGRSQKQKRQAAVLILLIGLAAIGTVVVLGLLLTRTLARSLDTERRQRERAETGESRGSFLAKASEVLGSSLEYRTTLSSVARLAVPEIADWCFVDMIEEGIFRRVAVAHRWPEHAALARELEERHLLDPKASIGPPQVIRSGEAELHSSVSEEFLRKIARTPEDYELLVRMGMRSFMCVPMRARGEIVGILTFGSTEAGRCYTAEDLRLAEELARRVGVAIDNARLYRDAREAVRLRDDFLSIASHELKTPIATLQLQIQSLTRRVRLSTEPGIPEKLLPRLATADRQIDRLARLVNSLLDISRITAGRLELELETVDLEVVVRDVLARFSEELERAGCAARIRVEESQIGQWDRTRLEQIVTNLISNAVKYGAGRPIEVTLSGDAEVSRLTVRDHGIGIGPEHQARIFGQFERAVSVRHYGGLGLGLWIVRQILEVLGGRISVESRPGEGSAFTVELPRRMSSDRAQHASF